MTADDNHEGGRTSDVVLRLVDEIDHERMASVLRHENTFLRARVEGRGRIEADPVTRRELETAREQVADLHSRVTDLTAQRNQLVERTQRLESEVRSSQLLSDRLGQLEQRIGEQAQALERHEQTRLTERDEHTARQQAWVDELEHRLSDAEAARSDLRRLLDRLAETPLAPVLRRRAGYRSMENRWRR